MQQYATAFTTGVISGLFTTLLVVVFRHLWVSTISPWLEELQYRDAKIEGKWNGVAEFDDNRNDVLWTIKRHGHRISATIVGVSGRNRGHVYSFTGEFKNLILTGIYIASDRFALDRGTFTLRLEKNGRAIRGQCAYYDDETDDIKTGGYTLTRADAGESQAAPVADHAAT